MSSYVMPYKRDPNAPKFDGKAASLVPFLDEIKRLADKCALSTPNCIKRTLMYAPEDDRELWELLDSAKGSDWDAFVNEICSYYPGAVNDRKYSLNDLETLSEKQSLTSITDIHAFGEYYRSFLRISKYLEQKGRISHREIQFYFMNGLHHDLRSQVRDQLRLEDPKHHVDDPYSLEELYKATLFTLSCDHHSNTLTSISIFQDLPSFIKSQAPQFTPEPIGIDVSAIASVIAKEIKSSSRHRANQDDIGQYHAPLVSPDNAVSKLSFERISTSNYPHDDKDLILSGFAPIRNSEITGGASNHPVSSNTQGFDELPNLESFILSITDPPCNNESAATSSNCNIEDPSPTPESLEISPIAIFKNMEPRVEDKFVWIASNSPHPQLLDIEPFVTGSKQAPESNLSAGCLVDHNKPIQDTDFDQISTGEINEALKHDSIPNNTPGSNLQHTNSTLTRMKRPNTIILDCGAANSFSRIDFDPNRQFLQDLKMTIPKETPNPQDVCSDSHRNSRPMVNAATYLPSDYSPALEPNCCKNSIFELIKSNATVPELSLVDSKLSLRTSRPNSKLPNPNTMYEEKEQIIIVPPSVSAQCKAPNDSTIPENSVTTAIETRNVPKSELTNRWQNDQKADLSAHDHGKFRPGIMDNARPRSEPIERTADENIKIFAAPAILNLEQLSSNTLTNPSQPSSRNKIPIDAALSSDLSRRYSRRFPIRKKRFKFTWNTPRSVDWEVNI